MVATTNPRQIWQKGLRSKITAINRTAMKERDLWDALDAITEKILQSTDLTEIFSFVSQQICQVLGIARATFEPSEATQAGICLKIKDQGKSWGWLNLSADCDSLVGKSEVRNFLDRVITLIQLACQKNDLQTAYQREKRQKENLERTFKESSPAVNYAHLVENVPVAIFQADHEGNCLYVNNYWCQIADYPAESALGKGWLAIIHLEDRRSIIQAWQLSLRQQYAFKQEFRLHQRDYGQRWVYAQTVPEFDENGNLIGYVGTLTDITNLKQIEKTLRKKQQQLTNITANIPVGLYRFIYHANGQVSMPYASAGFEALFGVHPQLLTLDPQLVAASIYEEDRKKIRLAAEKVRLGDKQDNDHSYSDYRLVMPSGQIKWVRDYANFSRTEIGDLILDGAIIDISEQKQAQEQIAFQANILDQVRNAVIATDLEGKIIYGNRYAQELFLLEESQKGQSVMNTAVLPQDQVLTQEILASIYNQGSWSGEFLVQRRDGSTFNAYVVDTLIKDEAGKPQAIVGVTSDISERKRLENAIRLIAQGLSTQTGAAFFQSLVKHLSTVLQVDYAMIGSVNSSESLTTIAVYGQGFLQNNFTYDLKGTPCAKVAKGQVCYYSDNVPEHFPEDTLLLEMGIESYLGIPLINCLGDVIGIIAVFGGKTLSNQCLLIEILQIFASQCLAEMERQNVLQSLQNMNELLEEKVKERTHKLAQAVEQLHIEIQERMQVESALRSSEKRYRNLVNMLPYGVQECDTNGLITYSNPAHDRMYGFVSGTLEGSYIWDRLISEKSRQELQNYLQFLNQEQPPPTSYFSVENTVNGEAINVQIDWDYLRNEQGKLTGYISILSNVTERHCAEQEIQKALLKERELNQLKTDFVDISSHEFRTPLTVILGSAQFLCKRYHQLSEEQRFEYCHRILEAGNQMKELLEDLLLISRADSGQIHLDLQSLNLEPFCQEIIAKIQASSDQEYHFKLTISPLQNPLLLDKKILHHILTNLLLNAVKYSPTQSWINLAIDCQDHQLIFTVADSGIGIPPEDQSRIFDSFHRGSNVGEIPGTGLGLKIVKKYVELLQGNISFQSQLGVGTTFVVTFPLLSMSGEFS
jgi:PAS domain S-box-containing protein